MITNISVVFSQSSAVQLCVGNTTLRFQAEPCASRRMLMQKWEKSNLNLLETESPI